MLHFFSGTDRAGVTVSLAGQSECIHYERTSVTIEFLIVVGLVEFNQCGIRLVIRESSFKSKVLCVCVECAGFFSAVHMHCDSLNYVCVMLPSNNIVQQ